jgi:hypothetical protein
MGQVRSRDTKNVRSVTHHGETDKHDEDRGDNPSPDHGDGAAVWEVVEDGAGDGRYHSPIIVRRLLDVLQGQSGLT